MEQSPTSGRRVLSVIIPCYNEAATIATVVEKVRRAKLPGNWQKEIIIVDDGSGPETIAALRRLEGFARVMYRQKNSGKGAVVKEGLRVANGDYCIVQDADLELDPAEYQDLFQPIEKGEVEAVFGYRVLLVQDSPKASVLFYGGRLLSSFFNIVFGTHFKDIPCCYKLFPRRCIPALLETPSDDFVFDAIEMTYMINHECSVAQAPVTYRPRSRAEGKKLRIKHGVYCAIAIILLRAGLYHRPIEKELLRFVRYFVSGLLTICVTLGVLYALTTWAHVWYLASSIVAFAISYIVNFSLHKFWTFKSPEIAKISSQLPGHLGLALTNLLINTALVYIFVEYIHVGYLGAQIIAAVLVALESFLILSRFVFVG